VPFPKEIQYSLADGAKPAATVKRLDDYTLQLDVTADASPNDPFYTYAINSI
jgi:hypothetical protein